MISPNTPVQHTTTYYLLLHKSIVKSVVYMISPNTPVQHTTTYYLLLHKSIVKSVVYMISPNTPVQHTTTYYLLLHKSIVKSVVYMISPNTTSSTLFFGNLNCITSVYMFAQLLATPDVTGNINSGIFVLQNLGILHVQYAHSEDVKTLHWHLLVPIRFVYVMLKFVHYVNQTLYSRGSGFISSLKTQTMMT